MHSAAPQDESQDEERAEVLVGPGAAAVAVAPTFVAVGTDERRVVVADRPSPGSARMDSRSGVGVVAVAAVPAEVPPEAAETLPQGQPTKRR